MHPADAIFYIVLITVSLFVIAHIKDFGGGWDEPPVYDYAAILPDVYLKAAQGNIFNDFHWFGDLKHYGPAYFLLGEIASRWLRVFTFLDVYDTWHIVNYLVFVMAAVCLYRLCQKFTDKWPAMLASLMYFSQPLLLGHAIMNPKDGAFAAFFLLAVTLGMDMIDAAREQEATQKAFLVKISALASHWYGRILIFLMAFIAIDRIGGNFITFPVLSSALKWAVSWPPASSFLTAHYFSGGKGYIAARHSIYVSKIIANVNFISTILVLVMAAILVYFFLRNATLFQRSVLWAGIALGLSTSIRILGPAAGALVLLVWILREAPRKVFLPALAYFGVAALTSFFFWPYLWQDTLTRVIETFQFMSLPWKGLVLLSGKWYPSDALPWYYLPKLIPIQITLPALLLFLVGCGLAAKSILKFDRSRAEIILPVVWFFFPLTAWMILRPTTFDNYRHFLFIMPPVFILAAMG